MFARQDFYHRFPPQGLLFLTRVLGVRVLAVFVGQQQTGVSLTNLENARSVNKLSLGNDLTFARSKSPGFINEPWKYFIWVCRLLSKPNWIFEHSWFSLFKINYYPQILNLVLIDVEIPQPPLLFLCPGEGNPWGSMWQTHRWCGHTPQCAA